MEWLECENEECKVWVSMKVPDSWNGGDGMFKCCLCVIKDVVEVRNENEKLIIFGMHTFYVICFLYNFQCCIMFNLYSTYSMNCLMRRAKSRTSS